MHYAIMTTSFTIIIWQFDVPYKVDRPTAINKGRSILIWVSWLTLKMLDSNENLHNGFRAILNRQGKALGGNAFLSAFLFWEKKRGGGGGDEFTNVHFLHLLNQIDPRHWACNGPPTSTLKKVLVSVSISQLSSLCVAGDQASNFWWRHYW